MIGPNDRIALPRGLEARPDGLHDPVRGCTVPVNATGLRALERTTTPRDAAEALQGFYGVSYAQALDDVLRFCAALNARLLLNVEPRGGPAVFLVRWLRCLPLAIPFGLPTAVARRRVVDTRNGRSLVRSASKPLAGFALRLFLLATPAAVVALTALGVSPYALAPALGAAVGAGVAVHELGHLAALRGIHACVVTRGLRIAVLHRRASPRRTRAVAASGPAAGLALATGALLALASLPSAPVATFGLVVMLNAFGLTTLSRDGRTLCGLS